jgi:hypothetical protein
MKLSDRSKTAGQGVVLLIILLAVIGGGLWWLYSHKNAMDAEGRAFGREVIDRIAVKHDPVFFANNLSPQARLDNPPSKQQAYMAKFVEMGVPAQPIKIDENMQWESQFFAPKGFFTAHLNYPSQGATMQIAIDHPVGKWQVNDITLTWDRPR